jgi:hypothetical protein
VLSPTRCQPTVQSGAVRFLSESAGAIKRQTCYRYRKIVSSGFSYEVYLGIFHLHVQNYVNFDNHHR